MAVDLSSVAREALRAALEASQDSAPKAEAKPAKSKGGGKLKSVGGLAAGAGVAALAPIAAKKLAGALGMESVGQLLKSPGQALEGVTSNLGDSVGSGIGDKISEKVDESGGVSGILSDTVKDVMPFGGGSDGVDQDELPGVGKGRRMPVQQSVDIGAPIETVYNQWTQFEHWPHFMHRVMSVHQEDDCTVAFTTKIWGRKKEFTAAIKTQRPDERVKWEVTQGIAHSGVVTFHELGPRLTRVLLGMDLQPGGMLEKAARGMRHVKRAARGDLHRFKAFIEMNEQETGAWRGVIEHGEVVEEHDPSYDEERDYVDIEDLIGESDEEEPEGEDAEAYEDEEEPEAYEEEEEEPEAYEEDEEEPEAYEDEEEPEAYEEGEEEEPEERRPSRGSRGRGSSAGGRRRTSPGHAEERRGTSRRARRS